MKFLGNRRKYMNKFIGCLVLSALTTMPAFAQSGTNSPYSQYGLGDLTDEGVGFNKGMGGVGYSTAVSPDRSRTSRRVDGNSMRRVVASTILWEPCDSSLVWVSLSA